MKMASFKSNVSYNKLISLRDKLTCLNGVITPEAVDRPEDELGNIFMVVKTHHYEQGQKYGQLASTIPKPKYRLDIGNAMWIHTIPAGPGAYSTAALTVKNAATLREQYVAEHKILMKNYDDYLGIKEADKGLILYIAGDEALFKKQYINFGDLMVLSMIGHLCLKTAIKMTTAQQHKYKTTGYNNPWDPTTSITSYFTQLDWFQVSLGDYSIVTSNTEKTIVAEPQIWQSKMFTEDQMFEWENKTAVKQTWAELQTYFTKKWPERKQYSTMTAKQLRFKEAALLA
jgi:hypothetical protein